MRPAPALQHDRYGSEQIAHAVAIAGWHVTRASKNAALESEVLALAQSFGVPVPGRGSRVVEILEPVAKTAANTNSLSALHGDGAFPLHTDGAHHLSPPRYLIFACEQPGASPVPTVLQRFDEIDLSDAERRASEAATFLFRNGRRSFYSTMLNPARPFVRFDQGCMMPLDDDARAAMDAVVARAAEMTPQEHHWAAGEILVLDNWRVLHGRGRANDRASSDRRLLRVSVQ